MGLRNEGGDFVIETYKSSPFMHAISEENQFKIEVSRNGCIGKGSCSVVYGPASVKGNSVVEFIPNEGNEKRLIEVFISGSLSTQASSDYRQQVEQVVASLFPIFTPLALKNLKNFSPDQSFSLLHKAGAVILLIHDQITPWIENEYRFAHDYNKPALVLANKRILSTGKGLLEKFNKSDVREYDPTNISRVVTNWLSETFQLVLPVEELRQSSEQEWDIFICHASEDKESFVRPLAHRLKEKGVRVWYDEISLKLGDNLRRSIDQGLSKSKYGIVVISPNFLKKEWPQKELDGLIARESDGQKVILPLWHEVDAELVYKYSPLLANRIATLSSKGLDIVVKDILAVLAPS
jgi:hypothetical protein